MRSNNAISRKILLFTLTLIFGCSIPNAKTGDIRDDSRAESKDLNLIEDEKTAVLTGNSNTWSLTQIELPKQANVLKIQFFDAMTGLVFSERDVFRTSDGGVTWESVEFRDGSYLLDASFQSMNLGYVISYRAKPASTLIERTVDGGKHWTTEFSDSSALLLKISVDSSGTMWAVGRKNSVDGRSDTIGLVLRRDQKTKVWADLSNKVNSLAQNDRGWVADYITAIKPVSDNEILLGSMRGRIYRISEPADAWTLVTQLPAEPDQTSIRDFGILPSGDYWVGGGARSTEGRWTLIGIRDTSGNWHRYRLHDYYLEAFEVLSENQLIAVGVRPGPGNFGGSSESDVSVILHSVDRGETWKLVAENSSARKYITTFAASSTRVYVGGTKGSIILLERNKF